jgi:large conductance mechanosensitive channel
MLKEFKEFALRGNVIDMAVGIIIGGAFGTIVTSLVSDILMPPIGLLLGGVDFSNFFIVLKEGTRVVPYLSLSDAQSAGAVTFNYGVFVNKLVSFLIISFAVFIMIKLINNLRRQQESLKSNITTKECPFCFSVISIKATRCPNCTSEIVT